jgi:hypothetical protein
MLELIARVLHLVRKPNCSQKGATIALRNYLLDGKLIQVSLYENGRIEQRDTASYVAKISNLTIRITVNGMPFEIDQHAILSTPNDLIYAIQGNENQVHILRALGQKLQGVDTIAMVSPLTTWRPKEKCEYRHRPVAIMPSNPHSNLKG